ncbi:MAG: hypothetical protein ACRC5T_04005 [Cetobacterium sp.]
MVVMMIITMVTILGMVAIYSTVMSAKVNKYNKTRMETSYIANTLTNTHRKNKATRTLLSNVIDKRNKKMVASYFGK